MLAEAPGVLHGWLRAGNTSASRGVSAFLQEALALLPAGWRLRTVRADSGFFAEELLGLLEARKLRCVIVARLTANLKRQAAALCQWTKIDEDDAVSEFSTQLCGWKKSRRFVVLRERIRESKAAAGRKLLDVPGYTFRIFVTDRSEDALVLWRD